MRTANSPPTMPHDVSEEIQQIDTEASFIELPESGLCVRNGELQRRNEDGLIIARPPIAELSHVALEHRLDSTALVFILGSIGAAIAAQLAIANLLWSWIVFAIFMFIGLLCFLGIRRTSIRVESANGIARYDAADPEPDVEGFILSLQSLLNRNTE